MLQPRRVAARTVAARVAWERGGRLGDEVGYQIRFDDQTSLGTRICFVTEGILLRWLQDDPTLADVAVILFDEFHERNLLSDVALALAKQLQATTRPDLKLAVMSATLDAEPVAQYLGDCPILISEGQSWPVETRFLDHHDERPITEQAADAVEQIVNAGEPGDVLVFMPGMAEINATIRALGAARLREPVAFLALHGDLPPEEQDRAFAPNARRKVVVATNVAETSVTIDGIRHVVDSGQARVARYDAERGISTLAIEPISRASADQRKGRAGRTAPGTCHRLWTESGHLNRPERNTPEIQRSDLAEVVLLLHSLGIRRAAEFDWLDKPDPQAVERAERLLVTLGRAAGSREPGAEVEARTRPRRRSRPSTLTAIGRQMLRLPMHPRYSRMLVEAAKHGCVPAGRVVRRAGERARLAHAPGPRRQPHRRGARTVRGQRAVGLLHADARLPVRQEPRLQRRGLPALRHPRPDGAAGGTDLRADSADRGTGEVGRATGDRASRAATPTPPAPSTPDSRRSSACGRTVAPLPARRLRRPALHPPGHGHAGVRNDRRPHRHAHARKRGPDRAPVRRGQHSRGERARLRAADAARPRHAP